MKSLLIPRGIITVLNTPFTLDNAIDVAGLIENVRRAIEAGVVGFLVPAMASEVGKLSEAERELMIRTVIETVKNESSNSKIVVIGGASASDTTSRVRLARRCVELGCDGVLASIPYEDEAQYVREVRALAEAIPESLPSSSSCAFSPFLMLQDWDATGYGVPVPVIARLFREMEVFRALKIEVVPAGVKYSAAMEATGGRLHLSGGWAVTQMIEALDRGVHAFMPTGMHAIYTRIYALHARGERDLARALFNRLLPVLAFSNQHLDISIHFFKRLLHRQGIYATPRVREPILPFDAAHERIAEELIESAMRLIEEVEAEMRRDV